MTLHPLLERASEGSVPGWARAGKARRAHMERVAALMEEWASDWNLGQDDRARWKAAGFLHDALRDADPVELRPLVPPELEDLPGALLHGPAAARLLEEDGVTDRPLLLSVAYHTLGHPELDRLGRSLYAADFLESGRKHLSDREEGLRESMLADPRGVVLEVARARVSEMVRKGKPLRAETVGFWNGLVGETDARSTESAT